MIKSDAGQVWESGRRGKITSAVTRASSFPACISECRAPYHQPTFSLAWAQALDETEFIAVRRVPLKELAEELRRLESIGCLNTEGLYFLAVGLELGLGMAAATTAPRSKAL